jgi:hypothetical protein
MYQQRGGEHLFIQSIKYFKRQVPNTQLFVFRVEEKFHWMAVEEYSRKFPRRVLINP